MKEDITQYYDELAQDYDHSRFANSYGQFIQQEEVHILDTYLDKKSTNLNLDLACGTGRFLDYASYGIDASKEMLKVAKAKFPSTDLRVSQAEDLPFEANTFENVISFHLMMHLEQKVFENILLEVNRVTKPNGFFIFDIPSEKRRKLTNYNAKTWHGGYQVSVDYVQKFVEDHNWKLVDYHGVSFFPLHRIPKGLRSKVTGLDTFLCNSRLKEYSSYLVFILQKK